MVLKSSPTIFFFFNSVTSLSFNFFICKNENIPAAQECRVGLNEREVCASA